MRSLFVIALLSLAALTAATAEQEYVSPQNSGCWSCHMPGDIRPMDPAYDIEPGYAVVGDGPVHLVPAILNTWKTDLDGVSLILDLQDAPDVRFTGESRTETDSQDAEIVVDPTAVDGSNTFLTRTHSVEVSQPVPGGASAIRVDLHPTDPASQVRLTLDAFAAGDRHPFATDEAGPGETAHFTLSSPEQIAALGGPWTLKASMTMLRSSDQSLDPQPPNVPVTFDITAWYNASSERVLVQTTDETLVFGDIETFPFDLEFGDAAGQVLHFRARAHLHFDHKPSSQATDDEWMEIALDVPVEQTPDGLAIGSEAVISIPVPADTVKLDQVSEAVGYGAAFLLVSSTVSGGLFGKGSRRSLNMVFGGARRRVAFHNFLSYGIVAAATGHLTLFLIENQYHWTKGLIWGGTGITMLFALGVTGALQVPIIRRWNYATWRWVHFGLAIGSIVFTLAHMMLDGSHFGAIQEAVSWSDPLAPAR